MKLTKLESYVYRHFGAGESLEEIAADLNRTVQSVSAAFNRACRKSA
jgi:DNA-binding CsgD family transcriptional regulator